MGVKDLGEQLRVDACSVVPDFKLRPGVCLPERDIQMVSAQGVVDGVFHQVQQHLLNQDGVHGNEEKFLRGFQGELPVGVLLAEHGSGGFQDLLPRLRRLVDLGAAVVVMRVMVRRFSTIRISQPASGGCPGAACAAPPEMVSSCSSSAEEAPRMPVSGGAQVVGHRPEQIAAGLFPVCLQPSRRVSLGLAGERRWW